MKDPKRNTVKEFLGPGVWLDKNNALHFNVPDLLKLFDLEDTTENRRIAIENIQSAIKEHSPEAVINVRKSPEE